MCSLGKVGGGAVTLVWGPQLGRCLLPCLLVLLLQKRKKERKKRGKCCLPPLLNYITKLLVSSIPLVTILYKPSSVLSYPSVMFWGFFSN